MVELQGKSAKIGSENGDFGHESHPFRHLIFEVLGHRQPDLMLNRPQRRSRAREFGAAQPFDGEIAEFKNPPVSTLFRLGQLAMVRP
jgi:hypothetical protein